MKPLHLGPNLPPRYFAGGTAIARLRGMPVEERVGPEDWVGSTTTLFGEDVHGLTQLPGGTLLRDAIAQEPEAYLGAKHVRTWGADPALLVKLLEAGERLPVHCHPDRSFARRHLDCPYGKTEAWYVVEASGPEAVVYLGFRRDMTADELAALVDGQRTEELVRALNVVPVRPGDTVLVPAGMPHAIGTGVFVVELQEPSDLSILMEWSTFGLDGGAVGHLGLGFGVALEAVDRTVCGARRLAEIRSARPGADDGSGRRRLFPVTADPYFRAERIVPASGPVRLDAGFAIVVVLDGVGELATAHGGAVGLRRGDTVLVPHAAGPSTVDGSVELIRCRPPDPADVTADA